MTVRSAAAFAALVLYVGCGSDRQSNQPGAPPTAARTSSQNGHADSEWFTDRANETGLDFVHVNGMSGGFSMAEILAPGAAVFDYDNDGDLDVYLVQGQMLGTKPAIAQDSSPARRGLQIPVAQDFSPAPRSPALRGRLYRNDLEVRADGTRTLRFTDVTDASGIDSRGYGMGVATGDVNNDGCVDLYLTNFGAAQMYHNNCDGTFTDVSKQSGTANPGWSVSAAFLDFDRDGWLDLYVGNYLRYTLDSDTICFSSSGARDYCTPKSYAPLPDRLYRNRHDGTFADVSARAGIAREFGPALGIVTADFNGDGWIDIYVANDGMDNQLWINQRNGTFTNTALLSGAALTAEGQAEASMGVDAGDFDNDGDEDLFMTEQTGEGANLYVNDGTGTFDDRSMRSGLGAATLSYTGFGAAWVDVDNDGRLDILTVNGAVQTIQALAQAHDRFPLHQRKQLLHNLGGGTFQDITARGGAVFQRSEVGRGAAFGDVDNDGDVDVVVGNNNGPTRLLINNVGSRAHWLGLRLIGGQTARPEPVDSPLINSLPAPGVGRGGSKDERLAQDRPVEGRLRPQSAEGRDMLGARVEILGQNAPALMRRAHADGSYASANDPRVLVGLGESKERPTVRVRWPGGRVEEWRDVPIDRYTTLKENSGNAK